MTPGMTGSVLIIDAMNVIGSRPDGWWRDREGAMRRFVAEVQAWAEDEVIVVLDSRAGRPPRPLRDPSPSSAPRAAAATPRTTRSCGSSRA